MSDDGPAAPSTVCPFCAVGCRLTHDGERVRGREGPANPNGRLCRKGIQAFDAVDDERLTAPLVRRDGRLVPVSWETALDRVVDGFEAVVAEQGANALAFLGAPHCTNEENYLLQKLARTLGTNNVDNRARLCHAETARTLADRLGYPASTNALADLPAADVLIVAGANPAARHPVAFDSAVRPAVADGATLVHVDPHENETTRLADRHVAPRPGTDALVATLLCSLVVANADVDRAFVRERTTGFERFRASVQDRDVDAAAATAGVDPGTLRSVAAAVGDADRVAVLTGTGVDETATADALLDLLLLTGNLGRPGTGVHVLRGLSNEQGATDAGCVPDRFPGHRPVDDDAARDRLRSEWGVAPPTTPGDTEHDLVSAFGDDVRAALVVGENPAVAKRDPDRIAHRLDALDLLVVTELSPSETTAHADVVLPAAAGVEKAGTTTNLDRQVQRLRPVADPPGEARPDFAVLRDLGRRLVGDAFDHATPRAAFAELTRVAPTYADLSYDALGERSRRWPARGDDGDDTGDGILYAESFATDDGRAPFVPLYPEGTVDDGGRDGLRLVVGDRAGGFVDADGTDRRLTVHPDDATTRGLADGDAVVVENDAATVETTARVSSAVRPGVVYLHADAADPLVRGGETTVTVRPAEASPCVGSARGDPEGGRS